MAEKTDRSEFLVSTGALASALSGGGGPVLLETGGVFANGAFRSSVFEYAAEGHIPGALYADVVTLFSDPSSSWQVQRPSAAQFATAAASLGITPETEVVVYDRGAGEWAARLLWVFRSFGHAAVRLLDGGLEKWVAEERAVETGLAVPNALPRADYPVPETVEPPVFVDTEDVQQALAKGAPVASALPQPWYDQALGHIPATKSLPSIDVLIGEDNTLRDPDEYLQRLEEAGFTAGGDGVLYCGTGVLSALLKTGLELAGIHDLPVYDGSIEIRAGTGLPVERTETAA